MRTTMTMCIKVDNFVKEVGLNWNLGRAGSTLQFKILMGATNKQINIGEVKVQRRMFWLMLIWFTHRILVKNLRLSMLGCCWKMNSNSMQNLCQSIQKEERFLLVEITHHLLTQRIPLKVKNMIRHRQCLTQLDKK